VPPDVTAAALALAWGAAAHVAIPERARPGAGLGAAAGLLALAGAGGASARDLGCDRRDVRAGLCWGAAAAAVTVGVIAAARRFDRRAAAFRDARVADASRGAAAVHLLVRIPFGTALAEELVFRGVVLGLGLRAGDRRRALAVSSLAFGLWHIGAALHPERQRSTAGAVGEPRVPTPLVVLGDVAATAIGGLGFGWLRLRSGSVAAPVLAHTAVNASAYLATRLGAPASG
jgi:membrane protease YdiL (CAAX protease family)